MNNNTEWVESTMTDDTHDYKREIEELKNMVMYLDTDKNIHDLISMQAEINKQFGNLISLKLSQDYESKQEHADRMTDALFGQYFI